MSVKAWNSILEPWHSVQVKQDHLRWKQFKKRGLTAPLVEVAKRQVEPLDWVASRLPGYKEEIWTEEAKNFLLQYLEVKEGVA